MAHAAARRRSGSGDEADHRLFAAVGAQERGGFLLGGAADLANHDDGVGLVVGEEHLEDIDELEPVDRIAADPDAARLAEPGGGGLCHRLIGERPRARDDADPPAIVDMARHDANLAFAGSDDPRAVRPDEAPLPSVEAALDADHV